MPAPSNLTLARARAFVARPARERTDLMIQGEADPGAFAVISSVSDGWVKASARQYIPFEPRDTDSIALRAELRRRLSQLVAAEGHVLHAVYEGWKSPSTDVENILLYNHPGHERKRIYMFLFRTTETKLEPLDPDNPKARWEHPERAATLLTHERDREFVSTWWRASGR